MLDLFLGTVNAGHPCCGASTIVADALAREERQRAVMRIELEDPFRHRLCLVVAHTGERRTDAALVRNGLVSSEHLSDRAEPRPALVVDEVPRLQRRGRERSQEQAPAQWPRPGGERLDRLGELLADVVLGDHGRVHYQLLPTVWTSQRPSCWRSSSTKRTLCHRPSWSSPSDTGIDSPAGPSSIDTQGVWPRRDASLEKSRLSRSAKSSSSPDSNSLTRTQQVVCGEYTQAMPLRMPLSRTAALTSSVMSVTLTPSLVRERRSC